jgi:hypothetical protein
VAGEDQWLFFSFFVGKSVEDMHALRITNWITVHRFYVDSRGAILRFPDIPPFPINSQAVRYLVEKGYLKPPTITKDSIVDRSKVDEFAKL